MIILLNKTSLYNTFGVKDFNELEDSINNMAPSMVDYYLSDLCSYNEESYLNKRNIEKSILIDDYSIYYDYNEDIYLEMNENIKEEETASLW